jgi:phospholipase C
MGYYPAATIAPYYAYAQNYTLADHFFAGVLGPTLPNRIFDLAATPGPVLSDAFPGNGTLPLPTIFDQLTAACVGWAYDYLGSSENLTALAFASTANQPTMRAHVETLDQLPTQLTTPGGPAVTVIDPSQNLTFSEHPPQNVSLGADWTVAIVNEILQSPVGSHAAIAIFYDESGGFWDPVVPPTVDATGDGFRVPLILVSPWTGGGHIDATPLDPASVLRLVDENWGLPFLNPRVATAASLLPAFNWNGPPRPPVILPTSVGLSTALGVASPSPAPSPPYRVDRSSRLLPNPLSSIPGVGGTGFLILPSSGEGASTGGATGFRVTRGPGGRRPPTGGGLPIPGGTWRRRPACRRR